MPEALKVKKYGKCSWFSQPFLHRLHFYDENDITKAFSRTIPNTTDLSNMMPFIMHDLAALVIDFVLNLCTA